MGGGIAADIVFVATNAGLVATPSPGSIFAYLAVTPPGQHFGVLSGVAVGAVGSFLVGSVDPARLPGQADRGRARAGDDVGHCRPALPA